MARSKKSFPRGHRGGKSYTLANQHISTASDPLSESCPSPPVVAPRTTYQNFVDTSFSTAVSEDDLPEKTASSNSRPSLPASPAGYVMNKSYQKVPTSTADSDPYLVEAPVDFEKELEKKTEEVSKVFDALTVEHEQRLAVEEKQNEMLCWMGDKWKAAEEDKRMLEKENKRLEQDKKRVEMELAEKDRLVEELQEVVFQQQSNVSVSSPDWGLVDDEKKACFEAAKQYDAAFSEAMNMVEKQQVELTLSHHRIKKLTLDRDILHHAIKHWLAITNKLVDDIAIVREDPDSGTADKMEEMLVAMAEEMGKQDVFMEDL